MSEIPSAGWVCAARWWSAWGCLLPVLTAAVESCEVRLMVQSREGTGEGTGQGAGRSQEPGSLGPWPAFLFTARSPPGQTFICGL